MELGIIGLGKMGSNMAERLRLAGHKVVGFDFNAEPVAKLTAAGSIGVIMKAKKPLALDLTQIAHIWQKGSVVTPGCSISLPPPSTRIPRSTVWKPGSPTPARAAGPSPRPSISTSPPPSSPSPSSAASDPAKKTTSRTV